MEKMGHVDEDTIAGIFINWNQANADYMNRLTEGEPMPTPEDTMIYRRELGRIFDGISVLDASALIHDLYAVLLDKHEIQAVIKTKEGIDILLEHWLERHSVLQPCGILVAKGDNPLSAILGAMFRK